MDLALNDLQRLICHKTQTTNQYNIFVIKCSFSSKPKIAGFYYFSSNIIQSKQILLTITLSPMNNYTHKIFLNHHHLVMPPARISLTLSCHSSLSFIASGRSSGLHPVSLQSCCMLVRAGHPAFARPCEGFHRSTSFMSSSLLLQ